MIDIIIAFIIGILLFIFGLRYIKKKADNYFSAKRNTNFTDFIYNLFLFLVSTIPFLWGGLLFGSFLIITFLFEIEEFWGNIVFIITAFTILILSLLNIMLRAVNHFSAIRKKSIGQIILNIILFFFSTISSWYLIIYSIILMLMSKFE